MKTLRTLLLGLAVACSGGGKSGGGTTPTDPKGSGDTSSGGDGSGSAAPADPVGVHFEIDPPDALVTIDDEPRGKASELDAVVKLPAGLHTFVVTHTGYKTYRAEFGVTDKVETFVVKLEKQ